MVHFAATSVLGKPVNEICVSAFETLGLDATPTTTHGHGTFAEEEAMTPLRALFCRLSAETFAVDALPSSQLPAWRVSPEATTVV
jgi:hypothetical protein